MTKLTILSKRLYQACKAHNVSKQPSPFQVLSIVSVFYKVVSFVAFFCDIDYLDLLRELLQKRFSITG